MVKRPNIFCVGGQVVVDTADVSDSVVRPRKGEAIAGGVDAVALGQVIGLGIARVDKAQTPIDIETEFLRGPTSATWLALNVVMQAGREVKLVMRVVSPQPGLLLLM